MWIGAVAACGRTPQLQSAIQTPPSASPKLPEPAAPEPAAKPLLAIDWSKVNLITDDDALKVWNDIAPTGADWQERLSEIPDIHRRPLAIALLRAGNLVCPFPKSTDCQPVYDVPEVAPTATLADPCLRRVLALWSIEHLAAADVGSVMTALRTVVAIPPPESELVSAALGAIPDSDNARSLELVALASAAGHRDEIGEALAHLDEASLIEAVRQHHIPGALEMLDADTHRAVYLTAALDEQLDENARVHAIEELSGALGDDNKLPSEVRAMFVKAVNAKSCRVAAAAIRALEQNGDNRYLPRPGRTTELALRAICVAAAYTALDGPTTNGLVSKLAGRRGFQQVIVEYDQYSESDDDGDGDPHTVRTVRQVGPNDGLLPEPEDMVRALRGCKGTTCSSTDHEFRFVFARNGGVLELSRLDMIERPPCTK